MVRVAAILTFAACIVGCPAPEPEVDLLAIADEQCLNQQWDAAVDTLRDHLIMFPDDAGAHFLLGRAHAALGHLVIAEGEFETALAYFVANDRQNHLPRFEDPQYFELINHVELCKVYQRQFLILFDLGADKGALRDRVQHWAQSLRDAREVNPEAPELEVFERLLFQARTILKELPAGPRSPDAPNVVPLTS